MAVGIKIPLPPAVTADGAEPYTPEQIVEHLRLLRQHIPGFVPMTEKEVSPLRKIARINDDMLLAAANTAGASAAVSAAIGRDAETLRNERAEASRWSAVLDEIRTIYKGVQASNIGRRHRLGLTALQTYAITRQLVRQPEHADLLPHLDAMRRAFRRKRRAEASPQPASPAES